jgi:hypothetical protein
MQSRSSKGQHDKRIAAGPTTHWPKLTQYRALSCHQQLPTTLAATSADCEPKVTHPEHWFQGVVPAPPDLGSLSSLLAVHCNSSCQGLCWRSTAAAALLLLLLLKGGATGTAAPKWLCCHHSRHHCCRTLLPSALLLPAAAIAATVLLPQPPLLLLLLLHCCCHCCLQGVSQVGLTPSIRPCVVPAAATATTAAVAAAAATAYKK